MSITRKNHYVPQWYQEGFFEPSRTSLAYIDMNPNQKVLSDGRVITQNGAWNDTPTSKAFFQKDLYSTFFGTSVNDEIERRLFGNIDTRGSKAIKAFAGANVSEWHRHFQPRPERYENQLKMFAGIEDMARVRVLDRCVLDIVDKSIHGRLR
jgi:hypothetical protein